MAKKSNKTTTVNETMVRAERFIKNVGKLDSKVHKRCVDEMFGTVRLNKNAFERKMGQRRLFTVTKSSIIHSGTYTMAGIRSAIKARIA